MKGNILDKITEDTGTCYLAKIELGNYIRSLPKDYKGYDVQREIVKNIYLDNLIETVLNKRHIPPIVLVARDDQFKFKNDNLELSEFKILDGLQRTFRLKSIYDTLEFLKEEVRKSKEIYELDKFRLSTLYKNRLDSINSSTVILSKSIDFLKKNNKDISIIDDSFSRQQWFEIWTGLSLKEEVNKMLILNAGHKPVKTKHQLELLFLNVIERLEQINVSNFKVLREKEINSTQYSKNRKTGEFHFSHLITSILSFSEAKPLTTNVDLIQKKQSDYFDDEIFETYMNYDFLSEFISVLLDIDVALKKEYQEEGTKWLGRETSLVGMFAAAGKYAKETKNSTYSALTQLKTRVILDPKILALDAFEAQRNSVNLAKVNIGSINKNAVFNGLYDILSGAKEVLNWSEYFKNTAA